MSLTHSQILLFITIKSLNIQRSFVFVEFYHLYGHIRGDAVLFLAYTRMSIETFDYIVEKITSDCSRSSTDFEQKFQLRKGFL